MLELLQESFRVDVRKNFPRVDQRRGPLRTQFSPALSSLSCPTVGPTTVLPKELYVCDSQEKGPELRALFWGPQWF